MPPHQALDSFPREKKVEPRHIPCTPPRKSTPVKSAPHTLCLGRARSNSISQYTLGSNRSKTVEGYANLSSVRAKSTPKRRNEEPHQVPRVTNVLVARKPSQHTYRQRSTPQRTMSSYKTSRINSNGFQFNPRKINKEDVQATDSSNASVENIAKWLTDDPFQKRKQILIRKGDQISVKAQAFEEREVLQMQSQTKIGSRVQRERQHFPEGKVSQGKDWLQNAFGESMEEDKEGDESSSVLDKRNMFESSFNRKR